MTGASGRYPELAQSFTRVASIEQLAETLASIRQELPFEHLIYHSLPLGPSISEKSLQMLTYSPEWISRYVNEHYFELDPVVHLSRRAIAPFEWSADQAATVAQRSFFSDADRHGVGVRGVVIPIQEGSHRAVFSATSNHSAAEWERVGWEDVKMVAELAACVHRKVVELDGNVVADLTHAETECLQILLHGLTPKQVAAELMISESRARYLIQRATGKLQCKSSTQAVALAFARGLIG
ncbi:MAG TPA: autoinducer binding domain-containing protein [Devosia sp.]|uniref:helix-turn-helix transcriptional regulator n=1 Tax=Devosia sp. TaxID=1871048 RepID=UPI002F934996